MVQSYLFVPFWASAYLSLEKIAAEHDTMQVRDEKAPDDNVVAVVFKVNAVDNSVGQTILIKSFDLSNCTRLKILGKIVQVA